MPYYGDLDAAMGDLTGGAFGTYQGPNDIIPAGSDYGIPTGYTSPTSGNYYDPWGQAYQAQPTYNSGYSGTNDYYNYGYTQPYQPYQSQYPGNYYDPYSQAYQPPDQAPGTSDPYSGLAPGSYPGMPFSGSGGGSAFGESFTEPDEYGIRWTGSDQTGWWGIDENSQPVEWDDGYGPYSNDPQSSWFHDWGQPGTGAGGAPGPTTGAGGAPGPTTGAGGAPGPTTGAGGSAGTGTYVGRSQFDGRYYVFDSSTGQPIGLANPGTAWEGLNPYDPATQLGLQNGTLPPAGQQLPGEVLDPRYAAYLASLSGQATGALDPRYNRTPDFPYGQPGSTFGSSGGYSPGTGGGGGSAGHAAYGPQYGGQGGQPAAGYGPIGGYQQPGYQSVNVNNGDDLAVAMINLQWHLAEVNAQLSNAQLDAATRLQLQQDSSAIQLQIQQLENEVAYSGQNITYQLGIIDAANQGDQIAHQYELGLIDRQLQGDQIANTLFLGLAGQANDMQIAYLNNAAQMAGIATQQQRNEWDYLLGQGTLGVQQGQMLNEQQRDQMNYLLGQGQLLDREHQTAIQEALANGSIATDQQRVLIEQAQQQANAAYQQGQIELGQGRLALDTQTQQGQQQIAEATLLGSLRGPRDAYAQQAVMHGINPETGESRGIEALRTGNPLPSFQAPQATPEPVTLDTFYEDMGLGQPTLGHPQQQPMALPPPPAPSRQPQPVNPQPSFAAAPLARNSLPSPIAPAAVDLSAIDPADYPYGSRWDPVNGLTANPAPVGAGA